MVPSVKPAAILLLSGDHSTHPIADSLSPISRSGFTTLTAPTNTSLLMQIEREKTVITREKTIKVPIVFDMDSTSGVIGYNASLI